MKTPTLVVIEGGSCASSLRPDQFERRIQLTECHIRTGLAFIGLALALPLTLLSTNTELMLIGAIGLVGSGMVAGYQAARMGHICSNQTDIKSQPKTAKN